MVTRRNCAHCTAHFPDSIGVYPPCKTRGLLCPDCEERIANGWRIGFYDALVAWDRAGRPRQSTDPAPLLTRRALAIACAMLASMLRRVSVIGCACYADGTWRVQVYARGEVKDHFPLTHAQAAQLARDTDCATLIHAVSVFTPDVLANSFPRGPCGG